MMRVAEDSGDNMSALRIIQNVMGKQPAGTEKAFATAIKPSVTKQIEIKRAEVGANIFNKAKNSE